jgi:hypothetical protein
MPHPGRGLGAKPVNHCKNQPVFFRQTSLKNGFVVRDAISQESNFIDSVVRILAYERRRRIDE